MYIYFFWSGLPSLPPASAAHSFNKGSYLRPPPGSASPFGSACLGFRGRSGGRNRGSEPRVSTEHLVLPSTGGAGALRKHKELRSWTLAGRWGDTAPGFVWLMRWDGEVGACLLTPTARVCV